MVNFLHSKNVYIKLDVGFLYSFNLFTKSFGFGLTGKSTTIAQKGEYLQKPFHKMPSARVSFVTYVKNEDDLALLLQLGYEQMTSSIRAIKHRPVQIGEDVEGNTEYKTIFEGIGIINSVKMTGRAGDFFTVKIEMNLEEYRHAQSDGISKLLH